jgi:hypothetical protein
MQTTETLNKTQSGKITMKSTIHIILKHNKRFNLSYMEEKDVLDQLEKNTIHAIPNMDSLF